MPTYVYQCRKCLEIREEHRAIKDRNRLPKCPSGHGPMPRHLGLEQTATDIKNWDQPVLSERMGVNPDQVPEHRRRFPKIPITDTGEIIVRNGAEERMVNRELRRAFSEENA